MPDYSRESYAVASLVFAIYVSRGYRTNSTEVLDTVWEYNSDSEYWTEGQPMLTARYIDKICFLTNSKGWGWHDF